MLKNYKEVWEIYNKKLSDFLQFLLKVYNSYRLKKRSRLWHLQFVKIPT